ncbi:MAG: hypothetical protein ACI9CO_001786 [Candidatus Azotimanducaceae bacterium]
MNLTFCHIDIETTAELMTGITNQRIEVDPWVAMEGLENGFKDYGSVIQEYFLTI